MKYFCISDLCGEYDKLINLLKKNGYNKNNNDHKFMILGNYIGIGKQSYKLFQFIKDLKQKNKAIVLRGNVDNEFVLKKQFLTEDLEWEIKNMFKYNKSKETYDTFEAKIINEILYFVQDCPYFYETKNHIFVYGGINPNLKDWRTTRTWGHMHNDSMSWMSWENIIRIKKGDYKNFKKNIISGSMAPHIFKFGLENGYPPNSFEQPDYSLINTPITESKITVINGSWDNINSKGIVYTVEDEDV